MNRFRPYVPPTTAPPVTTWPGKPAPKRPRVTAPGKRPRVQSFRSPRLAK